MTGRWAKEVLEYGLSRRAILKAAGTVAVAAAFGTLGCVSSSSSSHTELSALISPTTVPSAGEMVVATDADPAKLVDSALDAFGGLSGIVKKGDKVLVKANFTFARTVDQGACNQPQVLARIMQRLSAAGASEVTAFDHTIDNASLCLDRSGIKDALGNAGFKVMAIGGKGDYTNKSIPGSTLTSTSIATILNDADVLVNVPVVKSHSNTLLTAGMKNLMGVIWDRQAFHTSDLDACIADLASYIKPSLIIADAYRVLKTGGPGGGRAGDEVIEPHQLIVGRDQVAVDSYSATLLGLRGSDIGHIMDAYRLGLGEYDLSKVKIHKVG